MTKTEIFLLKAFHGDAIIIKTVDTSGNPYTILIDGGPSNTFDFALRKELSAISKLDLLILTHIDSDHIGGILKFIDNSLFDKITIDKFWINSPHLIPITDGSSKISAIQAGNLEKKLIDKKVELHKFSSLITAVDTYSPKKGIEFTILSPTPHALDAVVKEWPELGSEHKAKLDDLKISGGVTNSQLPRGNLKDLAIADFKPGKSLDNDRFNSASIAFILRLVDCTLLLLGDARAEIIEESLIKLGYNSTDNKLKVDFVKISHHGSKNNTSSSLLDLIDCENFIIMTNGGSARTKHPDRETVARILYHPARNLDNSIQIFLNYPLAEIEAKAGIFFTKEELLNAKCSVLENINQI
ncbi:MAG: MBL fold metallo-hydrolase [Flavobacterium sp.]|nr:MAG: MBL fold metallo-hydrolase [Flavobacterium sp.]